MTLVSRGYGQNSKIVTRGLGPLGAIIQVITAALAGTGRPVDLRIILPIRAGILRRFQERLIIRGTLLAQVMQSIGVIGGLFAYIGYNIGIRGGIAKAGATVLKLKGMTNDFIITILDLLELDENGET